MNPLKLVAATAILTLSASAQDAATTVEKSAAEKGKSAAERALELLGNKAKGIEDMIDKTAPDIVKEAENAPKALKPAAAAIASVLKPKGTDSKPAPRKDDPAQWAKNSSRKLAVMDVEFGGGTQSIMFELFESDAPGTVGNFIDNCESKAYNGLAIHRAIDGYLVQTGDPLTADDSQRSAWGTGGGDKTVAGEFKRNHLPGCVAMARKGDKVNPKRESNGYQFYFGLGNMSGLDGSYTVFGQVVSGLEILQQISQMPADSNDCPLQRIEVKSVKVIDHKGPLITMRSTGFGTDPEDRKRRYTKPLAAKGGWERFLERVW